MRQYYENKMRSARYFTDTEAWNIFRLAAFGEAFGWTLLISGILYKHYLTPGNNIPVEIVGQVHGTLFIFYIAAVVVMHPSLRWSPKRTIIAGLMSVPPYGTLAFEKWAAHKRHREALRAYRQITVRGIIIDSHELLVIQPKDSGYWYPPGGVVGEKDSAEAALSRLVYQQTGIKPEIEALVYMREYSRSKVLQLELYFSVKNSHDYREIKATKLLANAGTIDEISFIKPKKTDDLQPAFLRTQTLPKSSAGMRGPVLFKDD